MPLTTFKYFLYQVCLCFLFFVSLAQANETARVDFANGVEEYKQGHYDRALNHFKKAKSKGYQSAQLFHNLGVVYLKLDRLEQARESFIQTLRYPSIEALGHYNLALIALSSGDNATADSHFEQVVEISQDPHLTQLAKQRLLKERVFKPVKYQEKRWNVLVKAGKGYDDNVNFTPEGLGSDIDDAYTELLLYGTVMFTHEQALNIGLDAYIYDVNYDDIDANNYTQTSLLLKFPLQYMNWKIQPGLRSQWSRYGGKGYQKTHGFEVSTNYTHNNTTSFLGKYTYEDIDSLNRRYDFLEGHRQKLKLETSYRHSTYKTSVYYELEVNDRTNRINQSYSPTRNTLGSQVTYAINNALFVNANIKYQLSDYPAINTFERDDEKIQATWGAQYRLNKYISLKGGHTWTKNNSSNSRRDYDRHRVIFSLQAYY